MGSIPVAAVLWELSTRPRAIPRPSRQAGLRGYRRGRPPAAFAERFDLPLRTVYHLRRRGHAPGGQVPLPTYHRPPTEPHAPAALVRPAQALRPEHPACGAGCRRPA